jgi:hypothetical protein
MELSGQLDAPASTKLCGPLSWSQRCRKRESCACRESIPGCPARRCSDWAIPAAFPQGYSYRSVKLTHGHLVASGWDCTHFTRLSRAWQRGLMLAGDPSDRPAVLNFHIGYTCSLPFSPEPSVFSSAVQKRKS